jgi:hypothetical protein
MLRLNILLSLTFILLDLIVQYAKRKTVEPQAEVIGTISKAQGISCRGWCLQNHLPILPRSYILPGNPYFTIRVQLRTTSQEPVYILQDAWVSLYLWFAFLTLQI